jgi:CheY-like chemotaxis protein
MNSKARILLAEDDHYLRELMKEAMEENGYSVTDCADGQAAIDTFNKNNFDICLLDIMMPVKDGFMVAKKIRQQSDPTSPSFLSAQNIYWRTR